MLVTITGEKVPGCEETRVAPVSQDVPTPPKTAVSVRAVDTWVYVLVAGLFAVIAITVGMSY
ncbi:MAG: hypothetical protein KJ579_07625 [Verrucomicrobia bacterium]|nr:hypothetical protein [Verrucomicrobiota bacterium]